MPDSLTDLVIGLGNLYRRDDAVGLRVAELVRSAAPKKLRVIEGIADGTDMLNLWKTSDTVWVADCTISGRPPGSIYVLDGLNEDIPVALFPSYSTHTLNIVQTIALARTLNSLPRRLTIYGIEGENCDPGIGLTEGMDKAAHEIAEKIIAAHRGKTDNV